ncbi:MAG: hypothetical protein JKY23_01690, partial [Nitrospinaceae bacterium]|nr:hypothetical protein [Nitrospinaceae bacterium]
MIYIQYRNHCRLLIQLLLFFTLTLMGVNANAFDIKATEGLIEKQCTTCHKFEGKGESRFNLKAPDLMWGGSKFKRDWLVAWLQGKENPVYSKGYR